MNINSISGYTGLSAGGLAQPSPEQAAQTRQMVRAVQQLNASTLVPAGSQLALYIDPGTKLTVVRVIDAASHDVLDQIPNEDILRMTQFLDAEESRATTQGSLA